MEADLHSNLRTSCFGVRIRRTRPSPGPGSRRVPAILIGWTFGLLLLGPVASDARAAAGCTHWASPSESARVGKGTSASPFTISAFFRVARPDSVLCLKNGVYRGAKQMIRPPKGLSGTPGHPITIRAENDGQALIDGSDPESRTADLRPVSLSNNDHWVLEGFDAAHSDTHVIHIAGTQAKPGKARVYDPIHGVVVRRVVAWDANPCFEPSSGCTSNQMVVAVTAAHDVLLEDVAAFGTGRKVFQVYQSKNVTIRRAWGRWEGNGRSHVQTFSCGYRSYDVVCENVLATWSGESQPKTKAIGQLKTIIGMDWMSDEDVQWSGRSDAWNAGLRLLGSVAYVERDARLHPNAAISFGRVKNVQVRDVVAWVDDPTGVTKPFDLVGCEFRRLLEKPGCAWSKGKRLAEAPLELNRVTAVTDVARSRIESDWSASDAEPRLTAFPLSAEGAASSRPDVFDGTSARLCHRYVDGRLTTEPLWPWPMDSRIRAATLRARSQPVDVTSIIETLFGPIPSQCKRKSASPSAGSNE